MSDNVKDNSEAKSFNVNGSGGSPVNAADLFEEQAKVNHIPKEATQQLGNSVQAMAKEPSLTQPSDGETTRNDANISSRGGNDGVREIPKEAPTSDVPNEHGRVGPARPGDRERPGDPIDLGPNPYANIPGVPWFNNPESGPAKDFGPKDHAQGWAERVVPTPPTPPIRTVPSATGETERRPWGGNLGTMGGDIRPMGGDIRPRGGDIRPTGRDIRPTGGDIRPTGGDIRPTGGDIRPMGEDIRPMGDIRPDRGLTDRNHPGYPGMTIQRTLQSRRR